MEPSIDTNLSLMILNMDISKNCTNWANQIEECVKKHPSTLHCSDTKKPFATCLELAAKQTNCNVDFGVNCRCKNEPSTYARHVPR